MSNEEKTQNKEATTAATSPQEEKQASLGAASGKVAKIVELVKGMTVLEISQAVKALEEELGISVAAPVAYAGSAPAASAAPGEAAAEEKSTYTVVLAAAGDQKINVIKAVREIKPDLGLVEAKNLVESAPKEILKDVKKEEAEVAKKKLEAAGAKVELK